MKVNPKKCEMIVNTSNNVSIDLDNINIVGKESVKLLGIEIDKNLSFENHINSLCKNANNKFLALARIAPYMDLPKRKIIFNAFFMSQFSYSPLTWMLHKRELNHKINRLHERCLKMIYNDRESSFQELLDRDGSFSIHEQNIQKLCIEMYKVVNGLSPSIFTNLFQVRQQKSYELPNKDYFLVPKAKSVFCEQSVSVIGPKLWNSLPESFKNLGSLDLFKKKIKKWKPTICPCRICKIYFDGVGFL